jgi:hypothetical protein
MCLPKILLWLWFVLHALSITIWLLCIAYRFHYSSSYSFISHVIKLAVTRPLYSTQY